MDFQFVVYIALVTLLLIAPGIMMIVSPTKMLLLINRVTASKKSHPGMFHVTDLRWYDQLSWRLGGLILTVIGTLLVLGAIRENARLTFSSTTYLAVHHRFPWHVHITTIALSLCSVSSILSPTLLARMMGWDRVMTSEYLESSRYRFAARTCGVAGLLILGAFAIKELG